MKNEKKFDNTSIENLVSCKDSDCCNLLKYHDDVNKRYIHRLNKKLNRYQDLLTIWKGITTGVIILLMILFSVYLYHTKKLTDELIIREAMYNVLYDEYKSIEIYNLDH